MTDGQVAYEAALAGYAKTLPVDGANKLFTSDLTHPLQWDYANAELQAVWDAVGAAVVANQPPPEEP